MNILLSLKSSNTFFIELDLFIYFIVIIFDAFHQIGRLVDVTFYLYPLVSGLIGHDSIIRASGCSIPTLTTGTLTYAK